VARRWIVTTAVAFAAVVMTFGSVRQQAVSHRPSVPPPLVVAPSRIPTLAKIRAGRMLFNDRRFSVDQSVSCASCHLPEHAFGSNTPVSTGAMKRLGKRNALPLLNAAYSPSFLWDGAALNLEDQVRYPLRHPLEMDFTEREVVRRIENDPAVRAAFASAFGDPTVTYGRITQAIAAFEQSLVSMHSPFDDYYFGGRSDAVSPAAKRGFEVFRGKGQCASCHTFTDDRPFFTDFRFHNTGLACEVEAPDVGFWIMTRQRADACRFRTPSLRNVAVTAPYMHDGSIPTLERVVDFFIAGGVRSRNHDVHMRPVRLTAEDRRDLIAFLESLTDRPGTHGVPPLIVAGPAPVPSGPKFLY
jgi:cytochrome c peroxidase